MFIDVCLAEAAWIEEMAEPNKDNSEALLLRRDKDVKICKVKSSTNVMLSPLDYKFLTVIFSW
jgi:hypothetical protein